MTKIRWSEALTIAEDVGNYGVPVGTLAVWAGEADDAGHVEEDEIRFLHEHDGAMNEHGVLMYGAKTQRWVEASVAEMLAIIAGEDPPEVQVPPPTFCAVCDMEIVHDPDHPEHPWVDIADGIPTTCTNGNYHQT